MLLDNLKRDLNEAILQFKAKEETLTPIGNQHIVELHQRIDNANLPIQLRGDVMYYLTNTVPHKYFYFLPFVNDLRKNVENVFKRPEYNSDALSYAESTISQQKMRSSDARIADLEQQIKTQTFQEVTDLKAQVKKHAQTIAKLNLEVGNLNTSITKLQTDYNQAQDDIDKLNLEKEKLSTQNQNLMNRNLELEQRNRALEAELAGYRDMRSKRYSAQL